MLWGLSVAVVCTLKRAARRLQRAPDGHVVAVRITSEHAEDGFKPTCGHIDELHFRSTPEVWGYFSVKPGGRVHEFSDSQFGHVFAKGADRAAALKAMVVALKEIKIRGEIRTLVDYVIDMLQEPEFVGNQIHTGWLDGRIAAQVCTNTSVTIAERLQACTRSSRPAMGTPASQ